MGATENAGFGAKVQRNLALDFVTKQHKSQGICQCTAVIPYGCDIVIHLSAF